MFFLMEMNNDWSSNHGENPAYVHMYICANKACVLVNVCRGVTHVLWGAVYMCGSVCTLCDADVSPLGDICEKCDPMDHSVRCGASDGPWDSYGTENTTWNS